VEQADVGWQAQDPAKLMPSGTIQQHDRVCARCDVAADLDQMQIHRLGVGLGQDECRTDAPCRTDGTEDVGPVVALVARRRRPGALFAPDVGQAALLANARFVLPPEFDRLAASLGRDDISDQCGKVYGMARPSTLTA
jgi:hypothetical protein